MTISAVRRITLGAIAFSAAVSLAACGSNSSTSGSDASASAAPLPSIAADATLAAQVPEAIKSAGVMNFGTDASYAPMEFIAEDGSTIVGADIDLGNAVAAKLGLKANWENSNFDALIVGVTNGKFNGSMSSFTINADRLQQVNMISYLSAGTSWAVQKGNPQNVNIDQPCGKNVGVQKATVQVDDIEARSASCTAAGQPAVNIQQFTLQSDVSTALVSGKVDAMLADSPVTAYAVQQTNGQLELLGKPYDSAPYGIVIPKSETSFATTIQQAVQALIDDGSYQKILEKWNLTDGAISKSEVNPTPAS